MNSQHPTPGQVIDGRYRIDRFIARGGMAMVFQALDLRLDRPVALKVMHASLAQDPDFIDRFVREARSAAKLAHPAIVTVYDQGEAGGVVYLAMEYVPGRNLRDVLVESGPLDIAFSLRVIEQVLEALTAAHTAGIVHRDIKPENVLVTAGGQVKVADFGLARAIDVGSQNSATVGILIGTVAYLAPEQIESGIADERTDVYAVGTMLYECLIGKPPFAGETPLSIAYQHVHGQVPPPSSRRRGVPAPVDALVAVATARDPKDRYSDAADFAHHLRSLRPLLEPSLLNDTIVLARTGSKLAPASSDSSSRANAAGDNLGSPLGSKAGTTTALLPPPGLLPPPEATTADPAPWTNGVANTGEIAIQTTSVAVESATSSPFTPSDPPGGPSAGPGGTPGSPPGAPPSPPSHRVRRPWKHRRLIAILILMAVAALAGGGAWIWGSTQYTKVPSLIGMTPKQATDTLTPLGLQLRLNGEEFSEDIPKGTISSTDPAPNDQARSNSTIFAHTSKGPERHQVPNLRGMTLDQALAALRNETLRLGDTTQNYDDKVAAGRVISSSPAKKSTVKRETSVNLVVSKGPAPVDVPKLAGNSAEKAVSKLESVGLKTNRTESYSDTVASGVVISTSPNAGTTIHRGDVVTLNVSKGPPPVPVPDVTKLSTTDATAKLEAAGFKVAIRKQLPVVVFNRVYSQYPGGGSQAPRGSTVTITIV